MTAAAAPWVGEMGYVGGWASRCFPYLSIHTYIAKMLIQNPIKYSSDVMKKINISKIKKNYLICSVAR